MASNKGLGILRMMTVILGAALLLFVVLAAAPAFMPGTKVGRPHFLKAEDIEREDWGVHEPRTLANFGKPQADGGTPVDAGPK